MLTNQHILRISHGYGTDHVAAHLGISNDEYLKLESVEIRSTPEQAKSLSDLFNIDPKYFLTDDYSVVNHNTGPHSHSGPIHIYNSNVGLKELFEKLLKEKDELSAEVISLKQKLTK